MNWYGARAIFFHGDLPESIYEERITLHQAESLEEAIEKAEGAATQYGSEGTTYLGFIEAFWMMDEPGEGAEVFSLMRASDLGPEAYLNRFFDSRQERRQD